MTKIKPIILIIISLLPGKSYSQAFYGSSSPFVARFSSGWNYYSEGSSLNPQSSVISQYAMLNYRVFDDTGKTIRYQFRADIYQKDALTQTHTLNRTGQYDHRTVVRQFYTSYSINHGEMKVGRYVPLGTHTDAYPINGAGFENVSIHQHWRVSCYAGKIFDEYDNRPEGLGYNIGASASYETPTWSLGGGASNEQLRLLQLSKAYVFGEYRPTYNCRIASNNQYVFNKSLLGYSQNNLFYRFNKELSTRVFAEFHDRRAYFPAPTDSTNFDRFFITSKELVVGGSVRYQVFNIRKIGMLETTPSLKKRLGNDDLTFAALQFTYRNYYYWRFNSGFGLSYTDNQWIRNFRANALLNKDFLNGALDCSFSTVVNFYNWQAAAQSSAKTMMIFSGDVNYVITTSWNVSLGLYEELGNATDPHSGANLRMYYNLH